MKKFISCIGILIIILGLFSACGNKTAQYTYENEAVLDIKIEKTTVYPDKLVVFFADDSLSGVEEVVCYGSDFSVIEEEPEFSFWNDVLTIETENAELISGIKVWASDEDLYFYVRYLDSDSYAMLVYSSVTDLGYVASGDIDAYYTQAEKDQQRESAEKQAEEEALAFSKLKGEWISESENTRIVFDVDQSGDRYFTVYDLIDNEWIECDYMYISVISEYDAGEAVYIDLFDNPNWGRTVTCTLSKDASELQYSYYDEIFVKVK